MQRIQELIEVNFVLEVLLETVLEGGICFLGLYLEFVLVDCSGSKRFDKMINLLRSINFIRGQVRDRNFVGLFIRVISEVRNGLQELRTFSPRADLGRYQRLTEISITM